MKDRSTQFLVALNDDDDSMEMPADPQMQLDQSQNSVDYQQRVFDAIEYRNLRSITSHGKISRIEEVLMSGCDITEGPEGYRIAQENYDLFKDFKKEFDAKRADGNIEDAKGLDFCLHLISIILCITWTFDTQINIHWPN